MNSLARMSRRFMALEDLGHRPPWWRPFARRRWRKRYDAIMDMDVSLIGEMLAQLYPAISVESMAKRRWDHLQLPMPPRKEKP